MSKWVLVWAILIPVCAWAGDTRSIHIEWGYTPPSSPVVTGFQLYQDGVKLDNCFWAGADTSSGDCTVTLTSPVTNFTLTATFSDSTESPHSAPFAFSPYVFVKFGKLAPKGGRRGWVGLQ